MHVNWLLMVNQIRNEVNTINVSLIKQNVSDNESPMIVGHMAYRVEASEREGEGEKGRGGGGSHQSQHRKKMPKIYEDYLDMMDSEVCLMGHLLCVSRIRQ